MLFSEIAGDSGIFVDGDWIEKKDQDPNGKVRLIQLADIGEGHFLDKSNRFITESKAEELHCTFLKKGDILIARLGEPLCKACVFPYEGLYITAVDIAILRIGSDRINPEYIIYLVNSPWFKEAIKQYESGTTRKRISRKNLNRIDIDIPSIAKQNQIVTQIEESLSQLDSAVETLKKTKQQLEVYRQAVLKEAFSNFNDFTTLKESTTIITSGSRGWAKYYSASGAAFIRIGNLNHSDISIDLSDLQHVDLPDKVEGVRSRLEPWDILVSITADLGSIGLVPSNVGEGYINQHIALVRLSNKKQSEFIAWYLRSDLGQKELLKNKRGAGKLGLGLDDIRDSKIPVVDDETAKTVVSQIEEKLTLCSSIEKAIDQSLQHAEALRQSILKQAFEED